MDRSQQPEELWTEANRVNVRNGVFLLRNDTGNVYVWPAFATGLVLAAVSTSLLRCVDVVFSLLYLGFFPRGSLSRVVTSVDDSDGQ